jgi:putative membrane protein
VLPFHGHGFFPFFFLIPIFWILVVVLIVGLVTRRRRHWAHANGYGAWGHGHGGFGPGAYWAQAQAARSAESTLAERFAQGDIDEKEYRARLEVLRANVPQPPVPPTK